MKLKKDTKFNAVILQRFVPRYRVAVFKMITNNDCFDCKVIHGENLPGLKAKNSEDLSGLKAIKLKSRKIRFFQRELVWHVGLLRELINNNPSVIVCEAESHFLGYSVAIFYKFFLNRNVKLIQWCFFSLPGVNTERSFVHYLVKKIARSQFNGFISYAAYGKKILQSMGVKDRVISVATNVCDTNYFLSKDAANGYSNGQIRERLNLGENFIVSYIGTVDFNKNPGLMLSIANKMRDRNVTFLIVGDGKDLKKLQDICAYESLNNVSFAGRVSNIEDYYRVSDVVVIPGRGGIVISESMCFGTPVVVFQADGVELDLITNNKSGILLSRGGVDDFVGAIQKLELSPELCTTMGFESKRVIEDKYNTEHMASMVIKAIQEVKHEI